ncbi:hypothetical protein Kisp01_67490 [Kineosporia sp. NBRC 101677]|nr:hypothetical protein Kisp01_67490 [Kineosporia sp. NBRC 101677]
MGMIYSERSLRPQARIPADPDSKVPGRGPDPCRADYWCRRVFHLTPIADPLGQVCGAASSVRLDGSLKVR